MKFIEANCAALENKPSNKWALNANRKLTRHNQIAPTGVVWKYKQI